MDYIKNPIIAGLLTSGISYLILKYKYSSNVDTDDEDNSNEVSQKTKYSIILGILVFVGITVINTDYYKSTKQLSPIVQIIQKNPMKLNNIGDALPSLPRLTSIIS
jgi:accessory gene regulator protein AgrB